VWEVSVTTASGTLRAVDHCSLIQAEEVLMKVDFRIVFAHFL
jgi:hypothetical protein